MTATSIEPQSDLSGKNRAADRAFRWATHGAGVFVLLVLGAIALTMTRKAWPAFDKMGFDWAMARDPDEDALAAGCASDEKPAPVKAPNNNVKQTAKSNGKKPAPNATGKRGGKKPQERI